MAEVSIRTASSVAILRGIAALTAAIDSIGMPSAIGEPEGDSRLAKHIVDGEIELRALVKYALTKLASDGG